MSPNRDIAVYLVHGTFDARELGVPHWSDADGSFAEGVKARLPEDVKSRVKFEPFDWSGRNLFEEREKAADALTKIIDQPDDRLRFFIGHSHGGTVIADALSASTEPKAVGVLTLASPFVARLLKKSSGHLNMVLFAPALAFWIAFSGALASAIHQAWIGAGLCLAAAVIALFGFAGSRVGRWAALAGSAAIVILPLAFIVSAFFGAAPLLSTLPATLVVVILLIFFSVPYWKEWAITKTWAVQGISCETELPNAPPISLTALRLPGDEASFAIVSAQAVAWAETKYLLGTAAKILRFHSLAKKRAAFIYVTLWAGFCGAAALQATAAPWWLIPITGAFWMCSTSIGVSVAVAVVLLWSRVLTTGLLAIATGWEVLYGISAVSVYAEALPRWRSHANCHLEILGWTEEDAAQMPPLRHSMYRLGFVHARVAEWLVNHLEHLGDNTADKKVAAS